MQRQPGQELDAASRRLLLWTAAPVAPVMVHLARKGTVVSSPVRRPGGARPFTWQEAPVGFVLYGLMAYGVTCVIVLILWALGRFVWEERGSAAEVAADRFI